MKSISYALSIDNIMDGRKNNILTDRRTFLKAAVGGAATVPLLTTKVAAKPTQQLDPNSVNPANSETAEEFVHELLQLDSEEQALPVWNALSDAQQEAVNSALYNNLSFSSTNSLITEEEAYNTLPSSTDVTIQRRPGYWPSAYRESVTTRYFFKSRFTNICTFTTNVFWLHSRRYGRVTNVRPNAKGKSHSYLIKYRGIKDRDLDVRRRRWYCGYIGKFNHVFPGGKDYRPSIVTSGNYRGIGKTISKNQGK